MSPRVLRSLLVASIIWVSVGGCATGSPEGGAGAVGSEPLVAPPSGSGDGAITEPLDGYRLGNGDRIAIQVFDEPDLTMEAQVGASGSINYFYLGDIEVVGKTPQQLERNISSALSNGYLNSPAVNVTVLQYRPFFINGEVRSPGGYPYQPGLTLDRAIAIAGGLTDRASTRKMYRIQGGSDENRRKAVTMGSKVSPGDIISIEEGFF